MINEVPAVTDVSTAVDISASGLCPGRQINHAIRGFRDIILYFCSSADFL